MPLYDTLVSSLPDLKSALAALTPAGYKLCQEVITAWITGSY